MLRLHKGYSILFSLGVIKKLTQQYIEPFQVLEQVGHVAYKLNVPHNSKIYSVFSITQLEPTPLPAKNLFRCLQPKYPPPIFVKGDIDTVKFFEIDCLLYK